MGLSKLCRHVVMSCWNFVCPVTEPHHGAPPYFVYICLSAIPFTIYLDNYYCHQRQAGRPANEWSISLDVYGGQSQMRVFLMGHLQPIFIFWSFRTNITIFTINVNKCSSGIWCWDLNPQPSDHEYHPITTWPKLRPLQV